MVAAEVRLAVLGDAVPMTVDPAMSTSGSDGLASMMAGTAMPMVALMWCRCRSWRWLVKEPVNL
jgi:hypothetical protein